jgi:saccharopine dehydrogenase (NADP+, L-glutamate forming)
MLVFVPSQLLLTQRLKFLQHRFEIENKDGSKETITSTLSEYGAPFGSPGHSAMSRLVGTPCAIGELTYL